MNARPLVLMLLLSAPAYGADLPRFEVDALCAAQAHGSDHASKSCLRSEQYSYDLLKAVWPLASEKTRSACLRLAHFGAYQYSTIARCVFSLLPDQHSDEPVEQQGAFRY